MVIYIHNNFLTQASLCILFIIPESTDLVSDVLYQYDSSQFILKRSVLYPLL